MALGKLNKVHTVGEYANEIGKVSLTVELTLPSIATRMCKEERVKRAKKFTPVGIWQNAGMFHFQANGWHLLRKWSLPMVVLLQEEKPKVFTLQWR